MHFSEIIIRLITTGHPLINKPSTKLQLVTHQSVRSSILPVVNNVCPEGPKVISIIREGTRGNHYCTGDDQRLSLLYETLPEIITAV